MSNKSGIELIAAERARQIQEEGWTPEHDDAHTERELPQAAIAYVLAGALLDAGYETETIQHQVANEWPWEDSWLKLSDAPTRNLVKAGALIAAEIDRLQRQETNP